MNRVVVLVPGIMGSELSYNGEVIWPGPIRSLVLPFNRMNELKSDSIVATDIIRRYTPFFPQYQTLIDDMARLGYTEKNGRMVVFPYDWRKDNRDTAASLAKCLNKVIERQGINTEIALLAHSMGGLICRYVLESGAFNNESFYGKIKNCLFLGTPHKGSPLALARILGQERAVWLSAEQVREATNDPRFPSAYQLLPPPGTPFLWDKSPLKDMNTYDLYDKTVARRLGLNWELVEAARDFYKKLNHANRPETVRYFTFSGTRHATPILSSVFGTNPPDQLVSYKVNRDGGGDGVVPFWSSILSDVQGMAVGGEHSVIYQDSTVRRLTAALLGQPEVLGGLDFARSAGGVQIPRIDLSVRDKVLAVGEELHVSLAPQENQTLKLKGSLVIERCLDIEKAKPDYERVGRPMKISYSGPQTEVISLVIKTPAERGIFRVAFIPEKSDTHVGEDQFIVQDK